MSTGKFALLLAGALMVPQALAAKNVVTAPGASPTARSSALPLPVIPYLDTIPWLGASGSTGPRQKVDILLGPKFENIQLGFDRHDADGMQTRDVSMQRSP